MFVFDVETLSVESTCVVLSCAMTYMGDLDANTGHENLNEIYRDLLENKTLYVKFLAKEQIDAGRHVSKDTLEWWKQQDVFTRALAFNPSEDDVIVEAGIARIKNFMRKWGYDGKNTTVWIRGTLDQMAIDSLCKWFDVEPITHYGNWRDVRTAIDLLAESSNRGYCHMRKAFDRNLVRKHDPRHDTCYDALMLVYHV